MNDSTMEHIGLKLALSKCVMDWPLPTGFHPNKTIRSVEAVRKSHDILDAKAPAKFDLQTIRDDLLSAILGNQSLRELPRRHLRLAPWVIFYPHSQPEQWLANRADFAEQYLSWLHENGSPTSIAVLFRAFVFYYPKESPTFETWRNGLESAFANQTNKRLESLRAYCQYAGYLNSNGPAFFTQKLFDDPHPNYHAAKSGLSASLQQSAFLKHALTEYLGRISTVLAGSQISADRLSVSLKLFEGEDGRLRFGELRTTIAENLLRPFLYNSPPEDISAVLRSFLLRHLKDPRFKGSDWQGVDPSIQQIMRRWLVSLALEDFFNLLDDTAMEGHWLYRRAFWSAYLKKGVITDAWVVLGRNAKHQAKTYRGDKELKYGKLIGGTSDQSVLLLKIRNLIITEWSHNGSCRVFLETNGNKPDFYRWEYDGYSLKNMYADETVRHAGSFGGNWQAKISDLIYQHTRLSLSYREYMP